MKKYSKLLCAILTLCMMLTIMPFGVFAEKEEAVSFNDVENHWALKYIDYWANTKSADGTQYVIGGYPDGSFMPDAYITRGAAAAILDRANNFPTLGNTKGFPDVPEDNVFYSHIMACADNNVIKGYEDGTFKPGAGITRQAAVALIARCLMTAEDYTEYSDVTACQSILKEKFTDASSISSSFYAEMCFMVKQGILEGYADGTLRPGQFVTRAQFVKLLYVLVDGNAIKDYSNKTFDVSLTITADKKEVSDSVKGLKSDATVVDTIMSIIKDNRSDIDSKFKSEDLKKALDAMTAVYDINNGVGWKNETKAEWKAYINDCFDNATGDQRFMNAFADVDATLAGLRPGTYSVFVDGLTIIIEVTAY